MAQFYTLEEAARVLGMDPEALKSKAQRREVRAFLDSGSWRFRVSDIDELARQSGMGSDPDLSLSDLDLPGEGGSSPFDTSDEGSGSSSEFQLGVASPEGSSSGSQEIPALDSISDDDILLDDALLPGGGGSSSHIIGMGDAGKHPSDSDVRLVPEGPKGASDSDVQLSGEMNVAPPFSGSDSDVTLVREGSSDAIEAFSPGDRPRSPAFDDEGGSDASGETMLRPSPLGSSGEIQADSPAPPREEDSDFELTPSSVIDALQPESGSDFELMALDGSDEFDSAAPRPSDSDVTGAEPSTSGINLGQPSDSGINLQTMGELDDSDSIELTPLEEVDDAVPAPARPKPQQEPISDPGATALPTRSPVADPSATALPTRETSRDIFEDTDFEVDALDSGEDQTIQLEAASDFDIDDSDSASEVFALDEEDVDQSAATALGPAVLEEDIDLGAEEAAEPASDEATAAWEDDAAAEPASAAEPAAATATPAARRGAGLLTTHDGPPWGAFDLGALAVTTVLMLVLAFVTMDVVRNLSTYQGDGGPASGLVRTIAGQQ